MRAISGAAGIQSKAFSNKGKLHRAITSHSLKKGSITARTPFSLKQDDTSAHAGHSAGRGSQTEQPS